MENYHLKREISTMSQSAANAKTNTKDQLEKNCYRAARMIKFHLIRLELQKKELVISNV